MKKIWLALGAILVLMMGPAGELVTANGEDTFHSVAHSDFAIKVRRLLGFSKGEVEIVETTEV